MGISIFILRLSIMIFIQSPSYTTEQGFKILLLHVNEIFYLVFCLSRLLIILQETYSRTKR